MRNAYNQLYTLIEDHIERGGIYRDNQGEVRLDKLTDNDLRKLAAYCNMSADRFDQWVPLTESNDADAILANWQRMELLGGYDRELQLDFIDSIGRAMVEYYRDQITELAEKYMHNRDWEEWNDHMFTPSLIKEDHYHRRNA